MFWRKKKKPKALSPREEVLKQAQATAQAKREEIGDETLDVIRQAILSKENSVLEKARQTIINADEDKVRDHLKFMMQEDKP